MRQIFCLCSKIKVVKASAKFAPSFIMVITFMLMGLTSSLLHSMDYARVSPYLRALTFEFNTFKHRPILLISAAKFSRRVADKNTNCSYDHLIIESCTDIQFHIAPGRS